MDKLIEATIDLEVATDTFNAAWYQMAQLRRRGFYDLAKSEVAAQSALDAATANFEAEREAAGVYYQMDAATTAALIADAKQAEEDFLRAICPNANAVYCAAHDYDHVLARREQDDFNRTWVEHKNEFARQERLQEERAFMAEL